MKKEEKIQEILKRAYEYAKTGKYNEWISIEFKLRSEGFPEARRVLDDRFIREELTSICKVATSPEEVERRNRFGIWLKKANDGLLPNSRNETPDEVNVHVYDKHLYVEGPICIFRIRRRFGNNDLEVAKKWMEKDGRWLTEITYRLIPDSDLEKITEERTVELIMGFVKTAAAKPIDR